MPNFLSTGISIGGVHSDTLGILLVKVGDSGMVQTSIDGGRSIQQVKTPGKDIPWFYRTDMEEQELEMTFSLHPATPATTFDLSKRKQVFNWIYGSRGYLDVVSDDDVTKVYKCLFTSSLQFETVDLTHGYFTVKAQCLPHCYSVAATPLYNISSTPTTISVINGQNVMNSDMTYNYYPTFTIVPSETSVKIVNTSDSNRVFEISACAIGETIVVNGSNKTITGTVTPDLIGVMTGHLWPRLIVGTNNLRFDKRCTCRITTQYPILQ
jgi:hypothetical protein